MGHSPAQGHETDPDCNDYLTSKWLGLIRPLVAGFDRPLTILALSNVTCGACPRKIPPLL